MLDGALIGAAAGMLTATGSMAYAVRGRSSTFFGPSVYRGNPARPSLALTFDDGPSESTPRLLEVLAAHRIPATFFMCGKNVRRCPSIARAVAAAGHEIGNHTDSHPRMQFRSPEFIYRELALAQETIRTTTDTVPRLFRAPYGVRWFGLRKAQERLGLLGVMWTVIGRDWRWPTRRVAKLLLDSARNGAIFCLHDGRTIEREPDIRATLDAVEYIIPVLKDRGFQFETVSQILCPVN
ncbi:MAG TPA: polysaccharide deacetylase family protein [Bryobacteraceae bacterium]|nr:polysaccharide deacetylase family protein [Bryobacteraceae bacterium]